MKKETYYSKHREKVLEYQRKRYPAIKNKMKEYNHEYYEEHKPTIELNRQLRSLTKKITLLESKVDLLTNTMVIQIIENNVDDNTPVGDIEEIQNQPIIIETKQNKIKPKQHQITLDSLTITFD